MVSKRKGGNGWQKTTIRKIDKKDARQVCFAKRRQRLFNKATELAVMCGAEVAIVAFSPGGKAFSCGHLSTEVVVNCFLVEGDRERVLSAANDNMFKKLHLQHDKLCMQLKELKERKECMEESMAKKCATGDQIVVWLNPELGDMGEEEMTAFAAKLMGVRATVSERANQVLLEVLNIRRMLQEPTPPQQLFGGNTYEFGSGSNANTWVEMQQMQMVMPPMHGVFVGMDMHHMLLVMPPPPDLAYGMDMQQIFVSTPPSSGFGIGMEMQQMYMMMPLQPEFTVGMEMHQMIMAMPPPAGMEMRPPMGITPGDAHAEHELPMLRRRR